MSPSFGLINSLANFFSHQRGVFGPQADVFKIFLLLLLLYMVLFFLNGFCAFLVIFSIMTIWDLHKCLMSVIFILKYFKYNLLQLQMFQFFGTKNKHLQPHMLLSTMTLQMLQVDCSKSIVRFMVNNPKFQNIILDVQILSPTKSDR